MQITPDFLFKLYNNIAILGWLLIFFLPRWKGTKVLVLNGAWSVFMAVSYLIMILMGLNLSDELPDFGSVNGVMKIFSSEFGVLTGWVHYLCFDLLIGVWEVSDARKRGIKHWIVMPCLFFTFLLGPIGFLMYWIVRGIIVRKVTVLHD